MSAHHCSSHGHRALLTLTLLTVTTVLAACGDRTPPAAATPPALPVTVQRMQLQSVPIALEAVGQAEGSREIEVRARVSGILEKRIYDEGAPVKAGAVLFRIEREPFVIALAQAQAALGEARARVEQAEREEARLQPLVAQRAVGRKEYDDAVSARKLAQASVAGAKAQVDKAQLDLSYTTVKAPISGITGRAVQSEGSLLTAGTDAALLTTVVQMDPVWIRFSLPEADYEQLRRSEKRAVVRLLKQDGSVAADHGHLNFTGTTVDRAMGTVQLRAEFPNRTLTWLPGQFARVQVLAGQQQAYLVPQQAIMQTEQANLVWVVDASGKATAQPVQTANWYGSDWVVTGGLQPGDRVVVDNLMKIQPGTLLQPHEATDTPNAPTATDAAQHDTPAKQSTEQPAR